MGTHDASSGRLIVGLTGGIGVGKSTVAALLGQRGADVIDVDALGRDVLEPSGGAYEGVVKTFGESILADDRTIDRAKLAEQVFGGDGRLADLEAISHPAINARIEELVSRVPAGRTVILDLAVLAESMLGYRGDTPIYQRVVVVEAPTAVRIPRLIERGMTEEAARARMASQASDDERRRLADLVIGNEGSIDVLSERIDALWPTFEAWASQVD
jgi:dephospho-CoA kinase